MILATRTERAFMTNEENVGTYLQISHDRYRTREISTPLKKINLDPENPRIRYLAELNGVNPKTNKELAALLLKDPDIKKLYTDIKHHGGLQEPIVVNKDGVVIEGNSRVACYLTLQDNDKEAKGKWDRILCRQLEDQLPPDRVAVLQARYHVLGKNQWRAYAKAAHFHTLHKKLGKSTHEIHKETGLHEKTIKDMIATIDMMKSHSFGDGKKSSTDQAVSKYSYFFELQKSKNDEMVEFRKKPQNRKKFAKWVDEGKFGQGADVRKLPTLLKNAAALTAFETSGIESAQPIISKVDPAAESQVYKKVQALNSKLRAHYTKEVGEAQKSPQRLKLLRELADLLQKIIL